MDPFVPIIGTLTIVGIVVLIVTGAAVRRRGTVGQQANVVRLLAMGVAAGIVAGGVLIAFLAYAELGLVAVVIGLTVGALGAGMFAMARNASPERDR